MAVHCLTTQEFMHVLHMSWTGSKKIWDLMSHLQDQPQPLHQKNVHLNPGMVMAIVMTTSTMKFVAGMVETVVVMMLTPSTALNANVLILIMEDLQLQLLLQQQQ